MLCTLYQFDHVELFASLLPAFAGEVYAQFPLGIDCHVHDMRLLTTARTSNRYSVPLHMPSPSFPDISEAVLPLPESSKVQRGGDTPCDGSYP
jgi:hypothetical protein